MASIEADPNAIRRRTVPWHAQVLPAPWEAQDAYLGEVDMEAGVGTSGSSGKFYAMRTVAMPQVSMTNEEKVFDRVLRRLNNFSPNYEGNIFIKRNKSADIPPYLNTSLWITGLPAGCTTSMLLKGIAEVGHVGKIWCTHINKEEPENGKPFAAAKVVFFYREGAENLLRATKEGKFRVGGRRPRGTWNRVKSAPQKEGTTRSRVVLIRGPAELVNREVLDAWFSKLFCYQTEEVTEWEYKVDWKGQGWRTLEWRFGSHRCQAEAATIAMGKDLHGIVSWKYG